MLASVAFSTVQVGFIKIDRQAKRATKPYLCKVNPQQKARLRKFPPKVSNASDHVETLKQCSEWLTCRLVVVENQKV